MEDIVDTVAEEKIREAMRNAEFDDLPGKGKPLQLEDLFYVQEELRASFIILENFGILPGELQIEKEITSLKTSINSCSDEAERKVLKKELNEKILRLGIMREKKQRK